MNKYRGFPANEPESGYYLVSVNPFLILQLGLAPSPNILIARYDKTKQQWTAVLGSISTGIGNIATDIIAWRDIPLP